MGCKTSKFSARSDATNFKFDYFSLQNPTFCYLNRIIGQPLNEKAINGELNPAKPTALFAMSVLRISLSVFWLVIPKLFDFQPILKIILKTSGVSAMVFALFIFTAWHDVITYLSSALGVVALAIVLYGLRKSRFKKIFWWGIANLVLVGVNNFLYNSLELIYWLPLVQKVTFLCFLSWVVAMNFALFKHSSF